MTNRDLNGVLLKIAEECGETVQIISKTMFYGLGSYSPKDLVKQSNKEKLIEELGDILANIEVLIKYTNCGITYEDLYSRKDEKILKLEKYLPEERI